MIGDEKKDFICEEEQNLEVGNRSYYEQFSRAAHVFRRLIELAKVHIVAMHIDNKRTWMLYANAIYLKIIAI